MRLLKTSWIAFSILFTGCGVPRPDTTLCVLNSTLLYKYCYNLKNDYNDNMTIKSGAKPLIKTYTSEHEMLLDLDKNVATDLTGFGNLKVYSHAVANSCN